jgi:hypothetical protein
MSYGRRPLIVLRNRDNFGEIYIREMSAAGTGETGRLSDAGRLQSPIRTRQAQILRQGRRRVIKVTRRSYV